MLLLEQRLEERSKMPESLDDRLQDMTSGINALQSEVGAIPETLKDWFSETAGPLEDIQEELRRQERQEWRAGLKTTQILKLLA